jgi:hypothetical protein
VSDSPVQIPTNARTPIRANVPQDVEVQPWTIDFGSANPDLIRLYSVDGDPTLILVETYDAEGAFDLDCVLGLHGTPTTHSGSISLEVRANASPPGGLSFDVS